MLLLAPGRGPRRLRGLITLLLTVLMGTAVAPAAKAAGLPRLSLEVRGGIPDDRRVPGRLSVREDGRERFRGRIAIEVRGQSSQMFPKKSFGFEVQDTEGDGRDVGLVGLPEDDDWVLYAPYNDKSLMRNVLAYETSRRIGRYASRTRWVELWLDGRYHGVYVLMQRLEIGSNRIDIEEPAQLLEWTFDFQARTKGTFFRLPVTRRAVLFEDPEREDLSARRRAVVQRSVSRAERALYGPRFRDPQRGWRAHLDEGAAVDFVLLQELFKNQDAFRASTFLVRPRGGKWQLGPVWDFDIAMGNSNYGESRFVRGSMVSQRDWARRLYRDARFRRALAARWRELRAEGLPRELRASVASHSRRLVRLGAAGRNFRRWRVLGRYVWPNPAGAASRTSYASEVRFLRRWLDRRMRWMDSELGRR